MHILALTFALYSTAVADQPAPRAAAADARSVQAPPQWAELLRQGRYDTLAAASRDPLLTRRLQDLARARALQAEAHRTLQPRHPRRDAADDRVRLLEAAVVAEAEGVVFGRTQPQEPTAARPTATPMGTAPAPQVPAAAR